MIFHMPALFPAKSSAGWLAVQFSRIKSHRSDFLTVRFSGDDAAAIRSSVLPAWSLSAVILFKKKEKSSVNSSVRHDCVIYTADH